jgi:F0F1-type ATP synthase assembly protein I
VTRQPPGWTSLLGLGAVSALLLVVGLGLGWLADRLLQTEPIFTLIGLGLGIVAAGRHTYREARKFFTE